MLTRELMVRAMIIWHEHEIQCRDSSASTLYYDLTGCCYDSPGEDRVALSARTSYTLEEVEELVQDLLGTTTEKTDAAPVRT